MLAPHEEYEVDINEQTLPAGRILLNAVNSVAIEVVNIGGATNMEDWSIVSGDKTIYVFTGLTLEEDEKFSAAMAVGNNTSVKLVNANNEILDQIFFPGDHPGMILHRIPDKTGIWQWIMGRLIIGLH